MKYKYLLKKNQYMSSKMTISLVSIIFDMRNSKKRRLLVAPSQESVAPRMYHIHIDGMHLPEEMDRHARERFGFVRHNFIGHPDGYDHFEPNAHRTLKLKSKDKTEFERVWNELSDVAVSTGFIGYLEGEFISSDEILEDRSYDPSVPVPFRIERRLLRGEAHGEGFREMEFHLVMDRDVSDERLIKSLLDAGLYGAYLPKADHTALVLTMQGFKRDIKQLVRSLKGFLLRAGGYARCTIKEEIAIRYQLFGTSEERLPEIADRVVYV
jgi:hypothetical protein